MITGHWYTTPPWWPGDPPRQPSPEEQQGERSAAAIRVRARRRIALVLGVYPRDASPDELAKLLRVAMELEDLRRRKNNGS